MPSHLLLDTICKCNRSLSVRLGPVIRSCRPVTVPWNSRLHLACASTRAPQLRFSYSRAYCTTPYPNMADSAEDILEALYAEAAAKPTAPASESAAPQVDGVQLEALYEQFESAPTRKSPSPPPKHQRTPNNQQQQWRATSRSPAPPPAVATAPSRVVVAAAAVAAPTVVKPGMPLADLQVFNNAAVLVDKPKGWTSFDVCNAIKRALRPLYIQKVGHAGTLDPAATGLLIVCTGRVVGPAYLGARSAS